MVPAAQAFVNPAATSSATPPPSRSTVRRDGPSPMRDKPAMAALQRPVLNNVRLFYQTQVSVNKMAALVHR
ncbi:hypothetical protein GCM10023259_082750 [Thermocatellispora tengchongensis]